MKIVCPHCGAEASVCIVEQPGEPTCGLCQRLIPSFEPLFVIETYLRRQQIWSLRTFGEGQRTAGIVKHIEKELAEILAQPTDLVEWIDVVILALDGYWRAGGEPRAIMDYLQAKQNINFARTWPAPVDGQPTEHDRRSEGKCPTCNSPAPHLHPAMQFEGEVQPCRDPFHAEPRRPWLADDPTAPHIVARFCKRVPPIRDKDRRSPAATLPCECLQGHCMVFDEAGHEPFPLD